MSRVCCYLSDTLCGLVPFDLASVFSGSCGNYLSPLCVPTFIESDVLY